MIFKQDLKIPKERIAILIGTSGETKKEIERETGCDINIDSNEGIVEITSEDSFKLLICKNIVKAIARGFNPEIATNLRKIDYDFILVDLSDYVKTKKDLERLKGRLIGKAGKGRSTIENLTDTYISVYGKTVGIIGEIANLNVARRALMMLIEGKQHTTVFKWLEKTRNRLIADKIKGFDI